MEPLEARRLLAAVAITDEIPSLTAEDDAPTEILVRFKPGGPRNIAANILTNTATSRGLPLVPDLDLVQLPSAISVDEALAVYRTRSDVWYAEPNFVLQTDSLPNDSRFEELWGLHNTGQTGGTIDADIDAPEAWDLATGSRSIVVGVIDTGVDYTHPDLAANMWTNPGEIPGNAIDDDGNGYVDDVHGYDFFNDDGDPQDDNRHGTHVAGTIGGGGNNGQGVAGVNWNVQIMALKFLSAVGSGNTADAIEAVNYATMMRQRGVNIRLTSNSWGGNTFSQALQDAIAASGEAGLLFIAAAGNNARNVEAAPKYPAGYPLDNIISVAASDHNDHLAGFSNWGATSVDLAAPGASILSTVPGGSYATFNGTSMATPQVAGVAALAWSVAPEATYQRVRAAIFAGVDPIPEFQNSQARPLATGGRLNAAGTLQALALTVIGSTPGGNASVMTPPENYVIRFSGAIDPASLEAADFTVDAKPADAVSLSADRMTATFTFAASPVAADGPHTMHIAAGSIVKGGNTPLGIYEFRKTFYLDTLPLEVVSTVPQAGGEFTLPGPFELDVHFNEAVDPNSLQNSDLVLSGSAGAMVSGVRALDGNRAARFTIAGALSDGNLADGDLIATLAAGAIHDAFGNPNLGTFTASYAVDAGTTPFPASPRARLPLGSLVYERSTTANIGVAGDSDRFTLQVAAGQTLTILVTPTSSALQPKVELHDPAAALVGTQVAVAAGGKAALQTIRTTSGGTYTITVSGAAGTRGSYDLVATLNAALDAEILSGTANNSLATAQDLDDTSVDLTPGGTPSRLAVLGEISAGPVLSQVDFESGELPSSFTTYRELDRWGRIQVVDAGGRGNPSQFALRLDAQIFAALLNEAIYTIDLTGVTQANLSFSHISFGDEPGSLPIDFTGHVGGDGVAISDDGVRWRTILRAPTNTMWETSTFDLVAEARAADMTLSENFQIKFQQFEWDIKGGRAYDDIRITLPDASDTYRFTLAAGETASIGLETLAGGTANFELLSSSGAVLASGVAGPDNIDRVLANFQADEGGTYYLVVTGPVGATYSAVVTKNAALDSEPNTTISQFQPVFGGQGEDDQWLLGHVGSGDDARDLYKVSLAAGATLTAESFQPADGAGAHGNPLDPRLQILDAAGNELVSDDNGAPDGVNAFVSYANLAGAGIFYVAVAPSGLGEATSGEYAVRIRGNTLSKPAFEVVSSAPSPNAALLASPATFVVDFSAAYQPASVEATDLLINGVANSTGVMLFDGDTVRFSLPPLSVGTHTLSLPAGAVVDAEGTPLSAHSVTLTVGAPPRVVATSLPAGAIAAPGNLSYQVMFDLPIHPANLSADDFLLLGTGRNVVYTTASFYFDQADQLLTLNFRDLPEDSYTLTLVSGGGDGSTFAGTLGLALDGEFAGDFPSGNGEAGGNFVIDFTLDAASTPLPPLAASEPMGSLVYEAAFAGSVGGAGDTDSFTLPIATGQAVSVLITPAGGLWPAVVVRDPAGAIIASATATAAGGNALLSMLAVSQAGTYTITVSSAGDSRGDYAGDVVVNASLESESHGGPSNDTVGGAQEIDVSLAPQQAPLAAGRRGAVLGVTDTTAGRADYYSLPLAAGDVATFALTGHGAGNLGLELRDSNDIVVASSLVGSPGPTRLIGEFQVSVAGTYYIRVSGDANVPYSLLAVFDAALHLEHNDTSATAQNIDDLSGAYGAISGINTTTVGLKGIDVGSWASNGIPFTAFCNFQVRGGGGSEARNFFVFDLSSITQNIVAAALISHVSSPRGYRSPDPTETYTLFDISTPLSLLRGSALDSDHAIFNDLGTGIEYGGQTFSAADIGKNVPVALNASGLAALNAARGGLTALGGALTTINGDPNQVVFASSECDTVQLVLTLASDEDWYSFNVTDTSGMLRLTTSTPGAVGRELAEMLDPQIELYDPASQLVATGGALSDGRNEAIQYLPLVAGVYRVRVTSEGGTAGEYVLSRSNATLPMNDLTVTPSVQENGTATLSGAFSDADLVATHTVLIDWGPGQPVTTLQLPAGVTTFSAENSYLDDQLTAAAADVYPVHVTVTNDVSGVFAAGNAHVTVTNRTPSNLVLPPATVIDEDGTYTLTGTFHDPGELDTHTVVIHWGGAFVGQPNEGTTTITTSGPNPTGASLTPLGGGVWRFTAEHRYQDDHPTDSASDQYAIQVSVKDDDGGLVTGSTGVTVHNLPPVFATVPWLYTINENERLTLSGTFRDPSWLDRHVLEIAWENSRTTTVLTNDPDNSRPEAETSISERGEGVWQFTASHLYLDDSLASDYFANVATIVDDDGGSQSQTILVRVNNVAPTITALTGLVEDGILNVTGFFSDPGTLDTHTIVIDWSGSVPGEPSENRTTLTTAGPHPEGTALTYLGEGRWKFVAAWRYEGDDPPAMPAGGRTVALTITDDDAGTTSSTTTFFSMLEDTPLLLSREALGVPADALGFTIVSQPLFGSVSGTLADLAYLPDSDYAGDDRLSLVLQGGTSAGSLLTVSINVRPVNDPPGWTAFPDVEATDESGPMSFALADDVVSGPSNEAEQTVSFLVSVDRPDLFTALPAIDSSGLLTFTPAPNVSGVAIVSVYGQDDGGTAGGGSDSSLRETFQITIKKLHWGHNAALPLDVTGPGGLPDGRITPGDALAIINYINAFGTGELAVSASVGPPYLDTTGGPTGGGDNGVTAKDALAVINYLNAFGLGVQPGEGETGRSPTASDWPAADLLTILAMDVAGQTKRRTC